MSTVKYCTTVDIIRPQGVGSRTKRYSVRVYIRPKGDGHTNAVTTPRSAVAIVTFVYKLVLAYLRLTNAHRVKSVGL